MSRINLFTIPAGLAFADELARGIVKRFGVPENPFALSQALVLVPTRRAIRTLREAFERTAGGSMAVLPRIIALGDFDEEDPGFVPDADGGTEISTLVSPASSRPPISPLRRDMLLFTLIRRWEAQRAREGHSLGVDRPAIALQLARELARVLDLAAAEGVAWDKLRDLVPGELSAHWEQTIAFLDILATAWPAILEDEKRSDPAVHRDQALRRAAAEWLETPPLHPVIAAGSTGSVPATAELLHAVARLPQGAVVLPGLDLKIDDVSWDELGPSHPQHGMAQLLRRFGAERTDVEPWTDAAPRGARVRLIAEAMRPAATTVAWRDYVSNDVDSLRAGLAGLSCLVARSPAEEALAIACALREAVETPGRTASLVTPDRNLARRVASEMQRWGIRIDDSAGTPLAHTEPGRLLCAMADAVAEAFAPVSLLALLKHPQCRLQYEGRAGVRALTLELEALALRGPRPGSGLAGLLSKIPEEHPCRTLVLQLERAMGQLVACTAQGPVPLGRLLDAHRKAAELVSSDPQSADVAVWRGEAGETAFRLFEEAMAACENLDLEMGAVDYASFIRALMDQVAVRPTGGLHPRLSILGPLEARLLQADLVILGGLNEGKWPPVTDPGPWLNRPMRRDLEISQPERRIGLSAHDFAQAAASPTVILSRAAKEDGAPTTPSRWLTRIMTLVEGAHLRERFVDMRLVDLARQLDRPMTAPKPIEPPAPRPPVSARPRKLYVTDIERWLRDPYALYAKAILGLRALDPVDEPPGAAERGTAIHAALEEFVRRHPKLLPRPDQALEELLALGRHAFHDLLDDPAVRSIWMPRFERAATWFIAWEEARRPHLREVLVEQHGEIRFPTAAGDFTLAAKADRIEVLPDGSISICDYKTGQAPTDDQVRQGFSPQLTLEAAIAMSGGFRGLQAKSIAELVYVKLTGADDGGEARVVKFEDQTVDDAVHEAFARFKAFVESFDNPDMPYMSKPHVLFLNKPGDYDHLARVKEWSSEGGE
jgi:ATP-dependent helicase/nuclease subunit B